MLAPTMVSSTGFWRRALPRPRGCASGRPRAVGAVEWRFSNLLEQWLSEQHYRIEFINLGGPGFQSEDILKVVNRKYLPTLQPDLVLYAVSVSTPS
jgi:hypothetical protein